MKAVKNNQGTNNSQVMPSVYSDAQRIRARVTPPRTWLPCVQWDAAVIQGSKVRGWRCFSPPGPPSTPTPAFQLAYSILPFIQRGNKIIVDHENDTACLRSGGGR